MLSNDNYLTWTRDYRFYEKLRFNGPSRDALASVQVTFFFQILFELWFFYTYYAPQEVRATFNAYVGAVFAHSGMKSVIAWIEALVDPSSVQVGRAMSREAPESPGNGSNEGEKRPAKRIKEEAEADRSIITNSTTAGGGQGPTQSHTIANTTVSGAPSRLPARTSAEC